MTSYYERHNSSSGKRKITSIELARALYAMNGILIEYRVSSYEELHEKYPEAFKRFVDSLPELTQEEKMRYHHRRPQQTDNKHTA